jgi:RNA recognition motif-containing protein
MNAHHKTLWMGNIESWMNQAFLIALLSSINIFPQRIIVKNPPNKRGCAFLEFNTQEQAQLVLNNFNGKIINNLELKFNWVKTFEEKYSSQKMAKFTVSNYYLIIFNIF